MQIKKSKKSPKMSFSLKFFVRNLVTLEPQTSQSSTLSGVDLPVWQVAKVIIKDKKLENMLDVD